VVVIFQPTPHLHESPKRSRIEAPSDEFVLGLDAGRLHVANEPGGVRDKFVWLAGRRREFQLGKFRDERMRLDSSKANPMGDQPGRHRSGARERIYDELTLFWVREFKATAHGSGREPGRIAEPPVKGGTSASPIRGTGSHRGGK
jgi:hypothetical protein